MRWGIARAMSWSNISESGLTVVGPVHYGFARLQDVVVAVKSR